MRSLRAVQKSQRVAISTEQCDFSCLVNGRFASHIRHPAAEEKQKWGYGNGERPEREPTMGYTSRRSS